MTYTDDELAFLRSHRMLDPELGTMNPDAKTGFLATVSSDGQPDGVAVSYEFDGTFIYIGGLNQLKSRKYRNVVAGNSKVSFFIEEREDEPPRLLKWMRIYGTADIVERKGSFDSMATHGAENRDLSSYLRIAPNISWSFNLEGQRFGEFDAEKYKNRDTVRRNVHDSSDAAAKP